MSSNFFKNTQNNKGVSLFGNTQCSDETGVSSFKIRPSPNIDIDSSLGSEFEMGLDFNKEDLHEKFLDLVFEPKKNVDKSELSLVTTFTESSKSNETRASLNSCTDASIIEHETEPETKKGLDTRTHKTNTLCLFNQPKSNKSKKTENLTSTTKMETKKLITPRVFDGKTTMQLEERSKAKTISILCEGVSKTQPQSQISSNFLAVSFSELIGQVEATKCNLEKELDLTRRKLLKVESEKLERDQNIRILTDVNARTKSQVEALFKHVTRLDSDFNDLRHEKDKAEKKYQKIKDDTNRYKAKVGELSSILDESKQSLNSMRMQMQVHFKVKELEIQQKDVQLDEISGLLSEEKIKLAEMQKMSFDLSQWESKMLEMNQNLATDISDRFFNSIKQFIGSENLNNSLESKFQFIEKEFKSFLSNEIGSKVAELGAASLDKNQKLSVLVSTEFEKATMAGTKNHATTRDYLLKQFQANIGLIQKGALDVQDVRLEYDQKFKLLESKITHLETTKTQLERELSSHKSLSHDKILHLTEKLHGLQEQLAIAKQKLIDCDSTAERLALNILQAQEELEAKDVLLHEKDTKFYELQKNLEFQLFALQSKVNEENKNRLFFIESRNSLSKEVEVLELVIKNLTRDYEACQRVKATETLECDKWKIKYDDMKEQNDLLQETLRNCFAQNQESNDTVSQLMQQHVEQLNTVKSELNAERKKTTSLEQTNLKLQSEIEAKELSMKLEEDINYCKRMFEVVGETLKNEEAVTKGLEVQIKDISEFTKNSNMIYQRDFKDLYETLSSLKSQLKQSTEISSFRYDNSSTLEGPKVNTERQVLLPLTNQNLRGHKPVGVSEPSTKTTQRIKSRKKIPKSKELDISQEPYKTHRKHTNIDSNLGANQCKDTITVENLLDQKELDLKSRNPQKTLNKQIAEDVFSLSHITSSPPSKKSKKK